VNRRIPARADCRRRAYSPSFTTKRETYVAAMIHFRLTICFTVLRLPRFPAEYAGCMEQSRSGLIIHDAGSTQLNASAAKRSYA
jgi:hypothetical protein